MYEDKIVEFVLEEGTMTGRVISCEEGVGISIVDIDNPKQHLLCLDMTGDMNAVERVVYDNIYNAVTKDIASGVINLDKCTEVTETIALITDDIHTLERPSSKDCPFNR